MKQLLITISAVLLVACGPSVSINKDARDGNIEAVKQHLAAGADVNAKDEDGETPLHYTVYKGHKEIAELLIEKGADVDAGNSFGSTPLHNAAIDGHTEIVELLIAKGADVNAKADTGWTPLDWSDLLPPNSNKTEIIDLLHKHGGKRSNVINQSLKQLEMKYNNGKTSEELRAEGK